VVSKSSRTEWMRGCGFQRGGTTSLSSRLRRPLAGGIAAWLDAPLDGGDPREGVIVPPSDDSHWAKVSFMNCSDGGGKRIGSGGTPALVALHERLLEWQREGAQREGTASSCSCTKSITP
jgi:hypothetical protein